MFKRKCRDCGKRVERGFSFCPYCGMSFKSRRNGDSFGMLGNDDFGEVKQEVKFPFGLGKMMNSLVKQLENQMENMNFEDVDGMPKGIKIRVSKGFPQMKQIVREHPKIERVIENVSEEEVERRMGLPKVEGKSKVRRLADKIIYEIEAPGIQKRRDVVITELATGLEIRAYSRDRCYVKFIPLKVELIGYSIEREKVIVELRG